MDTSVHPNEPAPANHVISQNYPNPFNGNTSISFDLNQSIYPGAQLKIYNVRGQLVRNLQPAGNSNFSWDGRDNKGSAVAEGIYMYRLEADSFTSAPRKMVLLK